jgi:hypothetical protein
MYTYSEFVAGYRKGSLQINIDRDVAVHICDSDSRIPRAKRTAHKFWCLFGLLLMPVGLVSIFWTKWYLGLGICMLGAALTPLGQKTSAKFVLETALEDGSFYADMVERGVISFDGAV